MSFLRSRSTTTTFRLPPLACLPLGVFLALTLGGCGLLPSGSKTFMPDAAVIQEKVNCPGSALGWLPKSASSPTSDASRSGQAGSAQAGSGHTGSALKGSALTGLALTGSALKGFVPVQVIRCSMVVKDPAGKYTPALKEEHLEGDYSHLLAALSQPSDTGGSGPCRADMVIIPPLWLVDAEGRAIQLAWPLDACGKTRGQPDTTKALEQLSVGQIIEQQKASP